MNDIWYDNRPCDRFDPGYKKMVIRTAFAFSIPAVLLLYSVTFLAGGGGFALPFALALGAGNSVLLASVVVSAESRFPVVITFEESKIAWRTRNGKVRSIPYSHVYRISASRWKGDWSSPTICNRYLVQLSGRFPGIGFYVALTPENKTRLEDRIRRPA